VAELAPGKTHEDRGRTRRFDVVYATSDLEPVAVEHVTAREGVLAEGEQAVVIAALRLENGQD
jgi:hypothetical protein